ncbi:DUF3895 domain-containing protein [Paenibacillus sp. sgz302251]|uniref:DUF3895 domain-containing protein n=1 Tax=Paenibacillus sp. sgz302251 TaxID=3414493 RepID=UPI003C7D3813
MKYEPTMEQRDAIMGQLSAEQRHFMHHELVRGRRTLFARQLARKKCQFIPEDAAFEDIEAFIEEWDYIGFTDSGEVSPHTKCECGRSLRYQHQVLHLPTNTMRYFGIEHLQLHTGIDAKAVSAILKGFDVLDGEMNEMLYKYREGWQLADHVFLPLPGELEVPHDISAHLDAKLPLLDRQVARLRSLLRELDHASRQKRIASALTYFNDAEDELQTEDVEGNGGFSLTGADKSHEAYFPSGEVSGQAFPANSQSASGQAAFDFVDSASGQGAFDFGEADNGQAAFDFGDKVSGQGAFVFDEAEESQHTSALGFRDAADDRLPPNELRNVTGLSFEEAGLVSDGRSGIDRLTSSLYVPTITKPFYLPASAQRIVDDALKNGRISTRAVSDFLIEQKLVQDARMSTGKPEIYIAVAAYLDRLTTAGNCKLVTGGAEDRVYASAKANS